MALAQKKNLIGAHTSAAGGAYNALLEGKEIGATTIQLFTRNQKRWESKDLTEKEIELFHQTLEETELSHIMSHDSYLINLGCPNPENLQKSKVAFKKELIRCQKLANIFRCEIDVRCPDSFVRLLSVSAGRSTRSRLPGSVIYLFPLALPASRAALTALRGLLKGLTRLFMQPSGAGGTGFARVASGTRTSRARKNPEFVGMSARMRHRRQA